MCTLVQALRLCTGRTAYRGSGGIALPFHDHGTRRGWGVSVTPRPLFTPGKNPVPMVQESGWAPGPVLTGANNSAPPRFDLRTVQPVASRYTDWAPPAHHIRFTYWILHDVVFRKSQTMMHYWWGDPKLWGIKRPDFKQSAVFPTLITERFLSRTDCRSRNACLKHNPCSPHFASNVLCLAPY